eukprot:NODE_393_length_8140_cov_0.738341.p7 type:complete len:116 gc:universal NODE_393_length_8140_cov_0.738341:7110-6763(-)
MTIVIWSLCKVVLDSILNRNQILPSCPTNHPRHPYVDQNDLHPLWWISVPVNFLPRILRSCWSLMLVVLPQCAAGLELVVEMSILLSFHEVFVESEIQFVVPGLLVDCFVRSLPC